MITSLALAVSALASLLRPLNTLPAEAKTVETPVYEVWVTAYSSTRDQTDSTPFITASGTAVKHGVIAANFLEFGTKVRIPELFGDEEFTVEDRMNRRFNDRIDIWMGSRGEATRFGIQRATMVVIDG